MTLHVHRAGRADALADGLALLLAQPLADPFAVEVVVVPARGMERWLSQRLSHRLGAAEGYDDGVCAGIEFRSPGSLVAELTGTDQQDPWAPDALVWPLLEVIDENLDEPWAATLALHLGHRLAGDEADLRRGRRFALARRVAGLFAAYALQRPSVVADWSACRDTDGCGGPVPADLAWQPELWRRLVDRVPHPPPPERHAATVARLRADPDSVDLPPRFSLFGHTRLPGTEVELLGALAVHRDVHVWLPHPSPALWDALALAGVEGPVPRREDDSHRYVGHPLLASLGRDLRELQRTLPADPAQTAGDPAQMAGDPARMAAICAGSLLGWLQEDLAANRPGSGSGEAAGRRWTPADRSVQVHACHGPARQVEVLREVVLGLLADDPTLEPRDVLVMCPDIERYAPLIQAGFGLGEVVGDRGHPAHRLRVQLADRALHQTNPLLAVASRLLDLAGGRAGASEVLDLAHEEAVRRRFRFTEDDLQQLTTWVRDSGIRWAYDAEHRADYGLASYVQNTWRFGLDRLLAGVTMSADAGTWLDRTLPLDDVGSAQVDLAGRFAEYVDRLADATDRLVTAQPLSDWLVALGDAVASLTDVPASEGWQAGQLHRELGRIGEEAGPLAGTDLRLPDVRALLGHRLAGRPTRANFRTGSLTVCTMVPMRSVPHRVVCLLGLDDGVFPRAGVSDGDDLLAREPLTGERDPRSEDRQLLLDAIMAATETLVVTYTGADPYSGQPRPPAVPLGELLDALDDTATAPGGSVGDAVVVHHPLQPFDPRNVVAGALVPGQPFSFDPAALAGATAARGPRSPVPAFLPQRLPELPVEDVALDQLAGFLKSPVRDFLRTRLDVALPYDEPPVPDGLPVEIDALAEWGVGDRVLADLLAGIDPAAARQREWRRGVLPPGRLGWRRLGELVERARPLAATALSLRTRPATAVDVDVDLGGGRWLRGTVPGVYGDRLVPVSYSRLGATHRLQTWVHLLALAAADPDRSWTAHTIGRPANSRSPLGQAVSVLGPVDDHTARELLGRLVALRDRGLAGPLPLPLKTSFTYARLRRTHASHAEAVRKAGFDWYDGTFPGEGADPAQVRVWGARAALPGLAERPRPGEEHPGETTRFGALAMGLWSPLLDAEQGSW
ncbi:MAG TPA: exodeoxyribonuclease V subunit gamma [Nocardioides sp.]|uniref:exodeoxyribonuclease V subunit gamma n=1 Tax=Nocardioides sp. TaxID=35761 RepID=UPI002B886220|nr:exodeoxyribonuclease V subunit gamma [Nocardioides sp.]HQR27197.1 exodeoxyribonuclease V subunit gamma [Nocardioides sp.]